MATLFFSDALLPQGWAREVRIEIADGLIAAVASGAAARPGDERHALGLPGLPNLHSHAFQRGMAGLTEIRGPASDDFWTWRDLMYRFVGAMGPEDIEAVAAQAYVEMLEAGFTRVAEFHYIHHDRDGAPYADLAELAGRIGAAAQESGLGLTLLPVFYAHAGFGGRPPAPAQTRFISDLDRYARLLEASRRALAADPGAIVGVAPHSLRAATPEELAALLRLATGAPIHIHIAEQVKEVEDCLAWSGERPVQWLLNRFPVDDRWCLVHATHMVPDETRRLAESGAVAGLCPITEANLGDGIFDGLAFSRYGGSWGMGSDSNVQIGAAEELRQLEYSLRLGHRGRNLLAAGEGHSTGRGLFDAALAGGGRATGQNATGIAVGSSADLVSLEAGHVALAGRSQDAVLDTWIFAAGRDLVDCVWVRGRKLVENGRHKAAPAIAERFRRVMRGLLAV